MRIYQVKDWNTRIDPNPKSNYGNGIYIDLDALLVAKILGDGAGRYYGFKSCQFTFSSPVEGKGIVLDIELQPENFRELIYEWNKEDIG